MLKIRIIWKVDFIQWLLELMLRDDVAVKNLYEKKIFDITFQFKWRPILKSNERAPPLINSLDLKRGLSLPRRRPSNTRSPRQAPPQRRQLVLSPQHNPQPLLAMRPPEFRPQTVRQNAATRRRLFQHSDLRPPSLQSRSIIRAVSLLKVVGWGYQTQLHYFRFVA